MAWRKRQPGGTTAGAEHEDVLAGIPAFAACDATTRRRIAALGTEVRRGPDAVLVRAGTRHRQVLVVLDGVVAERPVSGRERAVSAGHVLGQEALWRAHPPATSGAVALTEVRLLVLGPSELADAAHLLQATPAAPAPARSPRPVLEPAWGSAQPALA